MRSACGHCHATKYIYIYRYDSEASSQEVRDMRGTYYRRPLGPCGHFGRKLTAASCTTRLWIVPIRSASASVAPLLSCSFDLIGALRRAPCNSLFSDEPPSRSTHCLIHLRYLSDATYVIKYLGSFSEQYSLTWTRKNGVGRRARYFTKL
jgi:hypothetical protein